MRVEYIGYIEGTNGKIKELVFINIDTLQIVRIPIESVIATLKAGKDIIGIKSHNDNIKAEHGELKHDYIKYVEGNNGQGQYIESLGISAATKRVILRRVYRSNGDIVGYSVVNPIGKEKKIEASKLSEIGHLIINVKYSNGKIEPYYNDIDTEEINEAVKNNTTSVDKSYANSIRKTVRALPISESKLGVMDEKCGLTLIEKITSAMMAIKQIRPYYYSAISVLNRVESNDVDTMGVSLDTLYINPDFALEIKIEEMIFILMHEIAHVIMMHNSRRINREHEIWNIACDYYVNAFVMDDLGIKQIGKVNSIEKLNGNGSVKIVVPSGLLYDERVDLDKDTPESLYEMLMKMAQNNSSSNSNSKGEDSSNSSGGQSGSNADSGNGNKGNRNSGSGSKSSKQGKWKMKSDGDIVDDERSSKMTQQQKKQVQKGMNRRVKQVAIQTGASAGIGNEPLGIERELEKTLVEKIDWKKAFRKMLSVRYERVNSFTSPDRRFIGRGMCMPGPKIYEEQGITRVRMYMDTSGSISNKDIYRDIKQAEDLMKQYKANGELYFWDTEVYGPYSIESINDLRKVRPKGGGGTDINCVFREEENHIKEKKDDVSDIILVWSDGYFGKPDNKFKRMFDKKTVFIIDEANELFKEPFGRKAYTKR